MAAHGLQMNGATATPLLRRAVVVALCRSPGRMGKARNGARTARRTVPTFELGQELGAVKGGVWLLKAGHARVSFSPAVALSARQRQRGIVQRRPALL